MNGSTGAPGFLRGFFYPKVLSFLVEEGLEYAINVPLWQWLGIREKIAKFAA